MSDTQQDEATRIVINDRWPGFTVEIRGPWCHVTHNVCGKVTHFPGILDDIDGAVDRHRCGAIGTRWEEGPSTPGAAHAFLLRSVAADVCTQPIGTYAESDDARSAAGLLIEALQSQLHAAEIVNGVREPGPSDPSFAAAMYAKRLSGRLAPNEPVYVSLGELAETGALPAAVETGSPALGVAWPCCDECAVHAVENLPRTLLAFDAPTLGLVLYEGHGVACASCPR